MRTVQKSVLVPHSAAMMFELVDDCESYPQFLPWCCGVELFDRTAEVTRARLDIDYHGLKTNISTLNRKQPLERMEIGFVAGPFERFQGHWRFTALGDAGCRVDFALDYAFSNGAMDALLAPVFGRIVETLVERFVQRAD